MCDSWAATPLEAADVVNVILASDAAAAAAAAPYAPLPFVLAATSGLPPPPAVTVINDINGGVHLIPHTSHLTRHTSHLTPHTSHLISIPLFCLKYLIPHTLQRLSILPRDFFNTLVDMGSVF